MKILNFNNNWNFCLGENWDDGKAVEVCLPHTVALTPENSSGCRNYQGKCIYRKNFFVSDEMKGQKAVLEFEGAMGVSQLFINGILVKEHFCGYTPLLPRLANSFYMAKKTLLK